MESRVNKKGLASVLIILLIIFGVVAGVKVISNSDSPGNVLDKIVERDIRSSDYKVKCQQGLTTYTITITPLVNINSCNVNLTLYNRKGEALYSDTQSKTNLIKGNSYSYTFEFGVLNSLTGSSVRYKITGKCVI